MSVMLERHDWSTGARRLIPVNTKVLQEIVDTLFHRSARWKTDPEWFDRQIRRWQMDLEKPAKAVVSAVSQPDSTVTLSPVPDLEPVGAGVQTIEPSPQEITALALNAEGKSFSSIKAQTGLSGSALRKLFGESP